MNHHHDDDVATVSNAYLDAFDLACALTRPPHPLRTTHGSPYTSIRHTNHEPTSNSDAILLRLTSTTKHDALALISLDPLPLADATSLVNTPSTLTERISELHVIAPVFEPLTISLIRAVSQHLSIPSFAHEAYLRGGARGWILTLETLFAYPPTRTTSTRRQRLR